MTINELNERISAEFAAIQTIENQASEESRDLNEQEIVSVEKHTETADGLIDERDELDRRVKARARQDELRKRFEGTAPKARVEHVRESVIDLQTVLESPDPGVRITEAEQRLYVLGMVAKSGLKKLGFKLVKHGSQDPAPKPFLRMA